MRWTPAVADLDTMEAVSPHTVLRSSGLYKVRGATVEGIMGGIFHQFGGSIAHRVFHTRVLPHLAHLGLSGTLRSRMGEVCERFGGREGILVDPKHLAAPPRRERERPREREASEEGRGEWESPDRPKEVPETVEYTRVLDPKQRSEQRQRMGYVG